MSSVLNPFSKSVQRFYFLHRYNKIKANSDSHINLYRPTPEVRGQFALPNTNYLAQQFRFFVAYDSKYVK